MKRFSPGFLFPLVALVMFIVVLNRRVFDVAPLGPALNPFSGIVQNEQSDNNDAEDLPGVSSPGGWWRG